jgi:predicted deacylase
MIFKSKNVRYYIAFLIFWFATTGFGLNSEKLLGTGKAYATPYYIIDSDIPGPAVCIVGGTHGDEPAGCRIARELLILNPDCGKLIIIPTANLRAVKLNRREIPGEGDLNRCYPGNPGGILMEQLAWEIFQLMKEHKIGVLIDLHESVDYHVVSNNKYLGQTLIAYENEMSIWAGEIAIERVNAKIKVPAEKFILLKNPIRGSTAWAAGKYLHVPAFTVETCKKLRFAARTGYAVQLIRCILAEVGVRISCQ